MQNSFDLNLNLSVGAGVLTDMLRSGIALLNHLTETINHMANELDDLKASVAANSDTINSAVVLINGIADRIVAAGADTQALADLAASLRADDAALAAAVSANTPVPDPSAP